MDRIIMVIFHLFVYYGFYLLANERLNNDLFYLSLLKKKPTEHTEDTEVK